MNVVAKLAAWPVGATGWCPNFTSHWFLSVLRVSVVKCFRHSYHHGSTENTENALRMH